MSITTISLSLMIPASLVTTILSIFVVISIKRCRRHSSNRPNGVIWGDNTLPTDVEDNMKNSSCYDEHWILPNWLQQKTEMIFPKESIVKGECIGRGQFGSVFKGKLIQGNAVYAI